MTPPADSPADSPDGAWLAALLAASAADAAPPAGFAGRAFDAVVRDRRRHARRTLAARAAVAAALLLGVGFTADGFRPRGRVELATAPALPAGPLADPLGEAREALASVTQRAGETALAPTRNLLASVGEPAAPAVAEPPAEPVSFAMLEPLTGTTRRAVSLFLKDVRQLTPPEPTR